MSSSRSSKEDHPPLGSKSEQTQVSAKDTWDKLDILLKPAGAVLAAGVATYLGLLASNYIERQQQLTTSVQLYAELMSSREAADSALRKEMFNTTLTAFLSSPAASPEERISRLELLAHNFHDSLDIASLFKHVDRQLNSEPLPKQEVLRERLEGLASQVNRQQLAVLESVGAKRDSSIGIEQLPREGKFLFDSAQLKLPSDKIDRTFSVEVLRADKKNRTLLCRLSTGLQPSDTELDLDFEVGIFDFPMIRNIRLPGGSRCALVITKMKSYGAEVTLIYFPGSRASLKEKPYYDEVLEQLLMAPHIYSPEVNHVRQAQPFYDYNNPL